MSIAVPLDPTGHLPNSASSFASNVPGNIGTYLVVAVVFEDECANRHSNKDSAPSLSLLTYQSIIHCVIFLLSPSSRGYSALGTHISFVRSITMDSFTDREIQLLKAANGNQQWLDFQKKYKQDATISIQEKYDSPVADLYKAVLQARIEGRPEPTELPKRQRLKPQVDMKRKMQGFGSGGGLASTRSSRSSTSSTVAMATAGVAIVAAIAWFAVTSSNAS